MQETNEEQRKETDRLVELLLKDSYTAFSISRPTIGIADDKFAAKNIENVESELFSADEADDVKRSIKKHMKKTESIK